MASLPLPLVELEGHIGRRCARPRHVHITRLTGRSRSHRAQRLRQLNGVALRVRDRHIAARNRRRSPPRSTRPLPCLSAQVPCVSRYTLPFLRRAPLRLANGGAGQQRSSTDHHHDTTATAHRTMCVCREMAISRSGNCRLLLWADAGAIPAFFLVQLTIIIMHRFPWYHGGWRDSRQG